METTAEDTLWTLALWQLANDLLDLVRFQVYLDVPSFWDMQAIGRNWLTTFAPLPNRVAQSPRQ
ncbi:hypothetical protein FF011L_55440 [Roseimaritima multifibrata]|uniref:Uncharacterized protein n=1 Tax=Roseimaritima multifibrata TaxID=1930274 RepID=A0A517MPC3_9BACT|nr:hypothetical protein FF011L_55440 [Roseimaritima multifibrata]